MIKPKALNRGDTVAVVSLSSGMGGEAPFLHRYRTGVERLQSVFGLNVVTMPHALKGIEFLYNHPELRAQDLMMAFKDPAIRAIICMIGGNDTIRLLPYIDDQVIRDNPKIFMGYSDSTINHLMLYKAGLVSFHGPNIMAEFAENCRMHPYTVDSINKTLFSVQSEIEIESSPVWTSELLDWADPKNRTIERKMNPEKRGYEILQGTGRVRGKLLGGCLGVLQMAIGTEIWPTLSEWEGKLMFLETAEDYPKPEEVCWFLRNLAAQGAIEKINGIIFGKPLDEKYYDEYQQILIQVIANEAKRPDLPILYNVNCSHTSPVCILPYGVLAEIDCERKKLTLLESAVC